MWQIPFRVSLLASFLSSQVCVPERATLDMGTVFQPCISWILLKWQRKWRCQVMGMQSNIGSRKGFSFTILNKNI